ncbi:hypothetical protein [Luteolibacter soli]|uniref:Uncharacterized protein n=1 Tax=Luteolibacter soli TaxID=3135280 RepID=A0ABU9B2S8_9BACT
MKTSDFPEEFGLLYRLRQSHPLTPYSALLDAFHLARSIHPEGSLDDIEMIASSILDRTAENFKGSSGPSVPAS